uniref:Bifunctional inhibitor/plant lipid transfer protein/seed storage helical domain-containing protein n=1 Tax=Leersia perrieri TaxID=77586 RepID=A0A0D9V7T2_9ORYZ
MESKAIWFLLVIVVVLAAGVETARGAGECGRVPVDQVALKLGPCAAATQNPKAAVPATCCAQVRSIGRNPKCLCAVMLSNTARSAGVKPAVAMTIPKRCAIASRPIGYKCGPYTLP